ncbi:hypothetical protein BDR05DRAFT_653113 [Suillus weaverae]|nr:hypothetical protein BDR05DRAFT_653113 [Suillus weaverae]
MSENPRKHPLHLLPGVKTILPGSPFSTQKSLNDVSSSFLATESNKFPNGKPSLQSRMSLLLYQEKTIQPLNPEPVPFLPCGLSISAMC